MRRMRKLPANQSGLLAPFSRPLRAVQGQIPGLILLRPAPDSVPVVGRVVPARRAQIGAARMGAVAVDPGQRGVGLVEVDELLCVAALARGTAGGGGRSGSGSGGGGGSSSGGAGAGAENKRARGGARLGLLVESQPPGVLRAAAAAAASVGSQLQRQLLLLLSLGKALLHLAQAGEVALAVQLLWVAGQYHPIEEGHALGFGDGKRRRGVRREGVQRASGGSLGDLRDGGGEVSIFFYKVSCCTAFIDSAGRMGLGPRSGIVSHPMRPWTAWSCSSSVSASSTWWLSINVGFGMTISGALTRSTSMMVPVPGTESQLPSKK